MYLRDNNAIRVSCSIKDTTYRAMQIKERLKRDRQTEPGKTQMEMSKEISISQAQVSRLEKGALDKIKS